MDWYTKPNTILGPKDSFMQSTVDTRPAVTAAKRGSRTILPQSHLVRMPDLPGQKAQTIKGAALALIASEA